MALTDVEIINGTLSLIFVIISFIVGVLIISKYPKSKNRTFIFVGLTWIGITSAFWGPSASYLSGLFTGEPISLQLYLLFSILLLPGFFFCWVVAFTDLVTKEKQKIILIIFAIEIIIFEIFFLYFVFTNPSEIGEMQSAVNMRYLSFVRIWVLIHAMIFLITGLLFARVTFSIGTPDMRVKGIFIAIAIISYIVGVCLDIFFPVGFILNRIILMSSAIEFYFGFILPDWLKKILKIEE
jgi:hypothetical protein